MTITTCKNCGQEIDTSTALCPTCNSKQPISESVRGKAFRLVCILTVIVLTLWGVASFAMMATDPGDPFVIVALGIVSGQDGSRIVRNHQRISSRYVVN